MPRNRVRNILRALCAPALLLAAGVLAGSAPAAAQTPFFRSFTFSGYKDGAGDGFYVTDDGFPYYDSPTPINAFLNGSQTFSGAKGSVTYQYTAASNYRGFWSTGTYAEGHVLNAYYPTAAPPSTSPPFGYYVIGGMGSWTRHRFESPESLTGPFGQFHWHVTGDADSNLGRADSRLDFAVGQGAAGFDDLYLNPDFSDNRLTEFGPGQYSYTTGVALGVPLDFLFWSSSFWLVEPADLATLGAQQKDIYGIAEFMRTFNIDRIDLFNGDGTPVNEWSLVDVATGQVIFNQNGRVLAAVPEPGVCALLIGLAAPCGLLLTRRRSRK